jgi:hypothetical protein
MALAKALVPENNCISFIIVTNTKHIHKLIVMLKLLESCVIVPLCVQVLKNWKKQWKACDNGTFNFFLNKSAMGVGPQKK